MGAWGLDTFENDTASDWAFMLEETDDLSAVQAALQAVIDVDEDYLDSDLACEGLAACEVVARLKGNWGLRDVYSEPVDKWVEAHPITPDTAVVEQALFVTKRVLAPPSELLELWEESGEVKEWIEKVNNLKNRVAA